MKERLLYWFPRVLTIIALLFMFMFSLDSFGGSESAGRKMLGFLIHNIPVLILTAVLIIAWKWELSGGLLFIIAFIISCFYFRSFSGNPGSLVVTSPFLFTGILFIVHHFSYRKDSIGRK